MDEAVKKAAVVLLSGGLDSATVLAVARRDGFAAHCVCFDYGQRHRHELAAAYRVAAQLGAASIRTVNIDLRGVGGSALTADIDVPKDRVMEPSDAGSPKGSDVPITYVPARNLVFLAFATALAETLNAEDLFIGVNAVDYSGYPDCRPAFIAAFEDAANLGTRAGDMGSRLVVRTPLIRMSKAEIIQLGAALGVDYALTHSCYDPTHDGLACGHCDSCLLRARGFAQAGVSDPTRYIGGVSA